MKRKVRRPVAWSSSSTSVPVMSDGMRSGVNWMRWNERFSVSASVEMRSVFARPGTPTKRQWPRANSAVRSWSMTARCPMMRFSISRTISVRARATSFTASRSLGPCAGRASWGSFVAIRSHCSRSGPPQLIAGRLLALVVALVADVLEGVGEAAADRRVERRDPDSGREVAERLRVVAELQVGGAERGLRPGVLLVVRERRRDLDGLRRLIQLKVGARELGADEGIVGRRLPRLLVFRRRAGEVAARAQDAAEPCELARLLLGDLL